MGERDGAGAGAGASESVDAMLDIIHLLEGSGGGGGGPGEDEEAERLLEVLVVKCAQRYDFTSESDAFVANATSRLFDGILKKWLLAPNWLRCPHDQSELDQPPGAFARPGLILNVLQVSRESTERAQRERTHTEREREYRE